MKENQNPFEIDFDSYIRQSEPEKQENGKLWQTAIGLQQVDGLKTSKYLYETAKRNIDGEITIEEAKKLIDSYYETRQGRAEDECDTEEADKVSVRIREILAEKTFSFTPDLLLSIHKRLFTGVFYKVKVGRFRDYNISKREWVFDAPAPKAQTSIISTHANGGQSPTYGQSVLYANADMIRQTLDYDFGQEKAFDYSTLSKDEAVKHLTRFVANIWQIHPFGEGNTRTTAVFTIKYLQSLGFDVNNEPFEKNSWYFRNALVRANYTNMNAGIYMNTEYLERFFRNLLLGEHNELKNRFCHIRYTGQVEKSEGGQKTDDGGQKKWSENTQKVYELIKENPSISRKELSDTLSINPSAVQKHIEKLKNEGVIIRKNGAKGGHWEIVK